MATRKYSYDLGQNEYQIVDAAGSGTTTGIELTVDLAKILSKEDVILALEKIENYLIRNIWPPA
jgi:hypothetical protein